MNTFATDKSVGTKFQIRTALTLCMAPLLDCKWRVNLIFEFNYIVF